MLENYVWNRYPVDALPLSPRASPGADPVADHLREFAASRNTDLPDPMTSLETAWEALGRAGVSHPGLAFASWTQTTALGGLLSSILANSPDVAAMLNGLERFHPLLDRDRITVRRRSASASVTLRSPDGGHPAPDTVDAAFALLCRAIRHLAGDNVRPAAVLLRRPAPADLEPYSVAFGRVAFAQPADSCVFDASALRTVIAHADATVLSMLEPYAQRRVAHRRLRWATAVSELVAAGLETIPRLADIARVLHVSSRTLQLRLAHDGRSFSDLVEAAQRDRALALLAQPDMPVTTIAARIGFANPAAFTRAFRRWTAMTPSQYRHDRPTGVPNRPSTLAGISSDELPPI